MSDIDIRTVEVYITTDQASYLSAWPGTDLVITQTSSDGGLFVENAANVGDEGSGIWVDATGKEHDGPGGDFVKSDNAVAFYEDEIGRTEGNLRL